MNVEENFRAVLAGIDDARQKRSVASDEKITLIVVTKNHGVELMREAIDVGATDIGENRVQEASEKFPTLNRQVTRHLIGHQLFDVIQSVDSVHLATALDKAAASIGKIQDVLIQVNIAREEQKSGVTLEDLNSLIQTVDAAKNLRLRGLMMIAPNFEDVENCRPLFRKMRKLFDELKTSRQAFDFLSMGMSHDYQIAVEEGANVVRIGTAILGSRT